MRILLAFLIPLGVSAQTWSGDIRVRGQIEKNGDAEARLSPRLRARLGMKSKLSDELRVEIRLATAAGARSTNQSLGDPAEPGSLRRTIGLDLAFAEWTPVEFAKLSVGRFPQIHFRPGETQMVLDDDLALEGVGLAMDFEFRPSWRAFGSAGSTFIRENFDNYYAEDLSDNMLNFGQAGLSWSKDKTKLTLAAGFFNFTSVRGMKFSELSVGGKANGNSEIVAGEVANAYLPRQYLADARLAWGALEASLFFETIENRETQDANRGVWTGFSLGQKAWDTSLTYSRVESDATFAMFTNSDFGNGVTDLEGYIFTARWKFASAMALRLTQFVGDTDITGRRKEYRRTHLDLSASF